MAAAAGGGAGAPSLPPLPAARQAAVPNRLTRSSQLNPAHCSTRRGGGALPGGGADTTGGEPSAAGRSSYRSPLFFLLFFIF